MIHNPEAEASTLAACLADPSALLDIAEIVNAEDFADPKNRRIYETIVSLMGESEPVSPISVANKMGRAADKPYLIDLLSDHSTAATALKHARIVADLASRRRLIQVANEVIQVANDPKSSPVERAEELIYAVADSHARSEAHRLASLIDMNFRIIEERSERGSEVTGLPSGFYDLDHKTAGFQPAHLVIVAARPSVGKSSLLADFALNAAKLGQPVLFHSLEMDKDELTQRFLASEAKVPSDFIRKGTLDEGHWASLTKAGETLSKAPLFIDDSAQISLMDIRARCRRMKAKGGLGLVILDYLQLMQGGEGGNRQEEIANYSRGLKLLAKEMHVPFIVAAQLNRGVEYRQEKRPMLADLRESGAIEMDADIVCFLYRPALYFPDADPGEAELIIAKQRGGPTGIVPLTFIGKFTKFGSALRSEIDRPTGRVPS